MITKIMIISILIITLSLCSLFVFVRQFLLPHNFKNIVGYKSIAPECRGTMCRGQDCYGEQCQAAHCVGINCKAGDCYGKDCQPGICTDPTCTIGNCVEKQCIDGKKYDINKDYLHYTQLLPSGSLLNPQLCDPNVLKPGYFRNINCDTCTIINGTTVCK